MSDELFDGFFSEIIVELEEKEHKEHPPKETLRSYLKQNLKDKRFPDKESLERFRVNGNALKELFQVSGEWTLTAVSLHVATCTKCSAQTAKMRARELAWTKSRSASRWRRLWEWLQEESKERIVALELNRRSNLYLTLGYLTASLLLFILSRLLVLPGPEFVPTSYPTGGCGVGCVSM